MSTRKCARCGAVLSTRNPGFICQPCQKKLVDNWKLAAESRNLDVEDMRVILGLESQEQVKRLARKDKLPPRIPAIKRWLWDEDVVRDWIRSGYENREAIKEQLEALAKAHGGAHKDEITGETKYGDKLDIQVMIYSKKDKKVVRETKKISTVIPRYHE